MSMDTVVKNLDLEEVQLDAISQLAVQFAQGTTMGEMRGLSDEHLEAIYSVAFNMYNNGRYEDAVKVFKFLCLHNHLQSKYWMGLAATQQMLKEFANASSTYAFAYVLDSDNPTIPLHAADCFLAAGNLPNAESALNLVMELTNGKPQFNPLRERAQVLLSVVKGKQG